MAIHAKCPHCLSRYTFADEQAGTPVPCTNPACNKLFKCPRLPAANGHANGVLKPAPANALAAAGPAAPPGPAAPANKTLAPTPPPMRPVAPPLDVPQSGRPTPPAGTPTPVATPQLPKPVAPPPRGKEPVAERAHRPPVDAEAVASAALADEKPAEVPAAERTVAMTCVACDHKWDEAWDKQGKNVVCPECRHRQKVPEQKGAEPGDWRKEDTRPSLAKERFEVPTDVQGGQAKFVSGTALKESGALEEEYERPTSHYVAALALLLAVAGGAWYGVTSRKHAGALDRQDAIMAKALEAFAPAEKDSELPPKEQPLYRAALHLAAGEYYTRHALRENLPDALLGTPGATGIHQGARAHFQQARTDLRAADKSPERDLLLAELAVAQVELGGTDQQVQDRVRLRWEPDAPTGARARFHEKTFSVLEELRQTFSGMADKPKLTDTGRDLRLDTLRRLARELQARGHAGVLDHIAHLAFVGGDEDPYVPEAKAFIAIERYRATKDADAARKALDTLTTTGPVPIPARVLAKLVGVDDPKLAMPPEPAGNGAIGNEAARTAYVLLHTLEGKADDAVKLAARRGGVETQLRALAAVADWTDPPAPDAISEAVKLTSKGPAAAKKPAAAAPKATPEQVRQGFLFARLAAAAARAKRDADADALADAIVDEGQRAWAHAEVARMRLAVADGKVEVASPDDPRKLRLGHAWGKLALARRAAAAAPNPKAAQDARSEYEGWGKTTLQPFGLAGLALGLQDRGAPVTAVAAK